MSTFIFSLQDAMQYNINLISLLQNYYQNRRTSCTVCREGMEILTDNAESLKCCRTLMSCQFSLPAWLRPSSSVSHLATEYNMDPGFDIFDFCFLLWDILWNITEWRTTASTISDFCKQLKNVVFLFLQLFSVHFLKASSVISTQIITNCYACYNFFTALSFKWLI